jgi:tetratricopeptide (TPR) repeat protein
MAIVKDLFLSHSHADKPFVRQLSNDCEQQGISVWVDEAELLIGDSLIQKIQAAIDRTRFFAAVVSANSVDSEWVKKELEQALESEISSRSVKVLPILLGSVDRPPGFLRAKLYADFSGWPKDHNQYETSLKLLVRSVSQRKLKEAETQLCDTVPEDLFGNEGPPSNEKMETAKSIGTTITDLEERSGLSSDAETYYRLGNLHFIEQQFEKTLEFYDRAIGLMPGHLKAWFNKARTLEELGRYEEAQEAYRSGDQFHPDPRALSSSLRNLACTYEVMGRPKEALEMLERAISVYPFEPYSYYSACKVCESLGLHAKAIRYIDQFLATVHYAPPYESVIKDAKARKAALMKQTENDV